MKMISDGWHTICGYEVFVEDGCIIRGVVGSGNAQKTAYPYRQCWSFNGLGERHPDGWDNCSGLSVDAFRAGVRRGTICMM